MNDTSGLSGDRFHVRAGALRGFTAGLFMHGGLPADHAETVADGLVSANLRGIDTHGVFRAPSYLKRLRAGLVNPRPLIEIERVGLAAASVDGDNGMGAVVGCRAMDEAIRIALELGTGLVSVRRSNHFGMAAYYALRALKAGLIGMVFTNASPAFPPWGGRAPFFGTNPLAVAVPSGAEPPFVLDMAMSVLARGHVFMAAQAGKPIPPGLALDADGRPTTDPRALIEGGTMMPVGGVKGAGLSMLMDILGGVLTGAAFAGMVGNPHRGFDRPQNVGHLFLCIRPDLFMPRDAFMERMDILIRKTKAQPLAAGVEEILIPGEREARSEARRLATGIPLTADVLEALRQEAGGGPLFAYERRPVEA